MPRSSKESHEGCAGCSDEKVEWRPLPRAWSGSEGCSENQRRQNDLGHLRLLQGTGGKGQSRSQMREGTLMNKSFAEFADDFIARVETANIGPNSEVNVGL